MTADHHERAACLDFVEREQPFVLRFLLRLGVCVANAEDAVQEAIIQAWRLAEDGFWSVVHEPRAGLDSQCRPAVPEPSPGRRRRVPEIPIVDIPQPRASSTDGPEPTAGTLTIVSTLAGLPPAGGDRLALKMDGFTSAETGAILGVSDQRARGLLKHARKRLRRQLAAQTGPDDGRTS